MGLFNSKELEKIRNENEELKTKFHFMYEKENQAENLKKALVNLKKEISKTNTSKIEIMDSLGELKLKHKRKESEVEQMNRLILELDKKKFELKETVNSYDNEIKNVSNILEKKYDDTDLDIPSIEDAKTVDDIELFLTNLKNSLISLKDDEVKLGKVIELKNLEIKDLENKNKSLVEEQENIEQQIEEKKVQFKEEQQKIEGEISGTKDRLSELQITESDLINKERELKINHEELEKKKEELKDIVTELKTDVNIKRELKDSLQSESLNLEEQIQQQSSKIIESIDRKKNLDEITVSSEKKLYEIDQSLKIKAKKLSSINTEILHQEQNFEKIKSEIDRLQTRKEKLEADFIENNNSLRNYDIKIEKIKDLCSLLEIRRGEIEKGNLTLENRFTNMFQKFNSELNKINQKRNLLEKIVLAKEKEIESKDQNLFEKIASLEESERVLNLRQVEVDSLEKYIKTLKEKKDYLANEININTNDYEKQKKQKEILNNEIQILANNKNKIDCDIQNLIDVMVSSYNRSDERKKEIEKDVKLYDEQLDTYKERINESMNELLEIQSSVSGLKLEHEELRANTSKLIRSKNKLHEDILKYQNVVQRYQNIKEKLKIEKALAKNKIIPGPYQVNENASKLSLSKEQEKGKRTNLFKY